MPSLPPWNAIHPLVVHFPVALLAVAPLFLLGALMAPRARRALLAMALALAALGTLATFLAVSTGEAAGDAAERVAQAKPTLERHEDLAETLQWVFVGLTAALAGLIGLARPRRTRPLAPGVETGLLALLLAAYLGGGLLLATTAHEGGRLVHELGVTARWGSAPAAAPDAAHD